MPTITRRFSRSKGNSPSLNVLGSFVLSQFCLFFYRREEGHDLFVIFNLYCTMRKSVRDAQEMEAMLKAELNDKFPSDVLVDAASIEVKGKFD